MSAEAVGYSFIDTLYRKQKVVLGDEPILAIGERMIRHLNRRGYKAQYDPGMYDPTPGEFMDADPIAVPRLETVRPVPAKAVVEANPAVLLSIGDEDLRCLSCGCWTFYVLDDTATCSGCRQKHTIRR